MATYDIRIKIRGNSGYVKSQIYPVHDILGMADKLILRSIYDNLLKSC